MASTTVNDAKMNRIEKMAVKASEPSDAKDDF
jgi:hypothetical protein